MMYPCQCLKDTRLIQKLEYGGIGQATSMDVIIFSESITMCGN